MKAILQQTLRRRHDRGVTMLVVLILLSVMLLGGLALARVTEVGTLASGNASYREAALQASEVGLNTAFMAIRGLANEETAVAGWYSPVQLTKDADGLPTGVDWDAAPSIAVGQMTVRYVAERACTTATVTHALRQCLVKQVPPDPSQVSRDSTREVFDAQNSRQFRITVRVTGPKGTQSWVQSLITKG